jgi:hypothetical protein
MKLTKELLKQMKAAKTIIIYRDTKGVGQMSLLFEDELRGVQVESRLEYLIDTELRNYGTYHGVDESAGLPVNRNAYCHAYLDYANSNSYVRSALRSLKVGDDFIFQFNARAGNQYVSKVQLFEDTCELKVSRDNGKTVERDKYLLRHPVCSDNSARMVDEGKRGSWSDIDVHSYKLQNRIERSDNVVDSAS